MTTDNAGELVRSCHELEAGAEIEARIRGERRFKGTVAETHPKMRLFWAVDHVGVRRIIELDEYEVFKLF